MPNPIKQIILLLLACLVAVPAGARTPKSKVDIDFRRYYDYPEMTKQLKRLEDSYSRFSKLISLGKSYEGRDIWMFIINNPHTGPDTEKPAFYIDGNTHGNELQGTEVALYTIWYLLAYYGHDQYVTDLLDRTAFYVSPTVNPDGRASFFGDPHSPHSSRSNRRPYDNDGDGRVDEDGPNDLDGDGNILMMRKKDPLGLFKPGDDPRSLERRDPDEKGVWKVYYSEGLDDDGDGRINEDPVGGVDLNRNFPADWRPRPQQYGAGDYPLSEPETRATALFILAHPNIGGIQSYHNLGGMILRGPGAKQQENIPRRDLRMFDALGKRGEEILPDYRYLVVYKDLYSVHGGFLDWGYLGLGIFSFSNELWSMPLDYDKDGKVSEKERLKWNDDILHGQGFVDWHPFKHPTLGEIEIGGWKKMARRIPPEWMLEDMCHRNCLFTLYHAEMMPRIKIQDAAVTALAGGLSRVWARIANVGFTDTATERARSIKVAMDDLAVLEGEKMRVLSGGIKTPHTSDVKLQKIKPERLKLGKLRGRSGIEIEWIVEGRVPLKLTVHSQKGGVDRRILK